MAHDDPHSPHDHPHLRHDHPHRHDHRAGEHDQRAPRESSDDDHHLKSQHDHPASSIEPAPPHPGEVPAQHRARAPGWAKVFVVTCSDSRTEETDASGQWLRRQLAARGHVHSGSLIVPDEPARIASALEQAKAAGAQVVLLTGGTGLTSRDSTFEAIAAQIARPIPGFGELFRSLSYAEIGAASMLSRAIAGVRADGLVLFAMPGSPAAVRLAAERLIFPELTHLLEQLAR